MVFEKYAFRICNELNNNNIFKIVDEPSRWEFVSDRFEQTVKENRLSGFKFKLVWDSDQE